MTESLLGLGWKSHLRLSWWEEGRIKAASALFTKSPSTVPIRTSEFVIADLLIFNWWLEWYGDVLDWPLLRLVVVFLWRLQRNEPGCVVGEQVQCFFWLEGNGPLFCCVWRGTTEIERPGELENRTDGEGETDRRRLTRVGEVERVNQSEFWVEKLEKLTGEEEIVEEQNRPDGETDRWQLWCSFELCNLFLDDDDSIDRRIPSLNFSKPKNESRGALYRRRKYGNGKIVVLVKFEGEDKRRVGSTFLICEAESEGLPKPMDSRKSTVQ